MGRFRAGSLVAIFSLMVMLVFGQEAPKQDAPKTLDSEQSKIFESFKDSAVDVQTTLVLETGESLNFAGSGTFIDKEGTVLTAAHVVKLENDQLPQFFGPPVKIVSYDFWVVMRSKNRTYHAEIIGTNIANDSALLKVMDIAVNDFVPAKIGRSDSLKIGEKVYAIGNTFGTFSNSLTSGHISGLHRHLGTEYLEDFIQSDTSINPGNSGGALINEKGELVGINTRGNRMGGSLALSVPINFINLDQLRKGDVALPWFGAEALIDNFPRAGGPDASMVEDLSFLNKLTGLRSTEQLKMLAKISYKDHWAIVGLVEEIKRGDKVSPAKRCGIKRGDLIVSVNGKPVQDGMEVRKAVVEIGAAKEFEIEYLRIDKDGVVSKMSCRIMLEKKPANGPQNQGGHRH